MINNVPTCVNAGQESMLLRDFEERGRKARSTTGLLAQNTNFNLSERERGKAKKKKRGHKHICRLSDLDPRMDLFFSF